MGRRPTITDVAQAAGVSVSTVDRVLSGRAKVKTNTAERVVEAAKEIGFYGVGAMQARVGSAKPAFTFGFLLQQGGRPFYRLLAETLEKACRQCTTARVTPLVHHLEDLSPEHVSQEILGMASRVDALAVVAAEHPRIAQAIESLAGDTVPVWALISSLSAGCSVGYAGLDNWKVGRTSAWLFHRLCKQPGKLAIVVGSHRYRCQELNESGFRSYFREHAPDFQLLEPMITMEDRRVARELTQDMLSRNPDLAGLYISGGGITGVLQALRENTRPQGLVTVGYEFMGETRAALIDGILSVVISHPLERLSRETVDAMAKAAIERPVVLPNITVPFDIYTSENI